MSEHINHVAWRRRADDRRQSRTGLGVVRFATGEEAREAIAKVEADHAGNARAAAAHFDSGRVLSGLVASARASP